MFLGQNKEIIDAERWAVSEALGIASKTARVGITPITIFCDSQKQETRFLRGLIYQKAGELQDKGHTITFWWTPSHSGLIGNEKADLAAKNRAGKGGRLILDGVR